jgi:hypothetical protein
VSASAQRKPRAIRALCQGVSLFKRDHYPSLLGSAEKIGKTAKPATCCYGTQLLATLVHHLIEHFRLDLKLFLILTLYVLGTSS